MNDLILALQITVLGMFLICVAMVLLWTLLSLFVFVLAKAQEKAPKLEENSDQEENQELMRQHAVAIAVSTAIHQRISAGPGRFPLPPTAIVSAWQAVLRSQILSKRGVIR
jgi:Na+-transporting methylmalonyl-CoA/oxaloacetate decarboxylase gamma subunit